MKKEDLKNKKEMDYCAEKLAEIFVLQIESRNNNKDHKKQKVDNSIIKN